MPEFARRLADQRPHEIALRDSRQALTWAATGDIVDDLGRNAMGKINKRALRSPYWTQVF